MAYTSPAEIEYALRLSPSQLLRGEAVPVCAIEVVGIYAWIAVRLEDLQQVATKHALVSLLVGMGLLVRSLSHVFCAQASRRVHPQPAAMAAGTIRIIELSR